jgi:hypothetical protein
VKQIEKAITVAPPAEGAQPQTIGEHVARLRATSRPTWGFQSTASSMRVTSTTSTNPMETPIYFVLGTPMAFNSPKPTCISRETERSAS